MLDDRNISKLTSLLCLSARMSTQPSRVALHLIMKARPGAFFIEKISFQSYANETNFHVKSFALSLVSYRGSKQLGNGLLTLPGKSTRQDRKTIWVVY